MIGEVQVDEFDTGIEVVLDNGKWGKRSIYFETGLLAKQATGSVVAYLDKETMVLSTTTIGKEPKEQFDFFPLTVDVEEKQYAVGKIPGSFYRREGRPATEAILAARLIDRPLRPAFDKGMRNEVQVIETVLSVNPKDTYDILAINAASCSTMLTGVPFTGPIGAVRLSLIEGDWVAFPTYDQMEQSVFNMVVAGRIITDTDEVAIMMVEAGGGDNQADLIEAGASKSDEAKVAEGLEAAKPFIQLLCKVQAKLIQALPIEAKEYPLYASYTLDHLKDVTDYAKEKIEEAIVVADKSKRNDLLAKCLQDTLDNFGEKYLEEEDQLEAAFHSLEKELIRSRTLREEIRIDGRTLEQIRPIMCQVQLLPRTHGSALFQRGETQILGVTTLAPLRFEQQLDNLSPITAKRYMHQYNFPPFSTGEVGRVGSPKRREIGHGDLAERALRPVLPSRQEFPYAIRQVSEALGSNGSTSMGSVCASSLSLLQAGVPLKSPVAGIAMGLMSGEIDGQTKTVTLTDIQGIEDGYGDMDFKVAGTADYITALQLDTKLDGINSRILADALEQAKRARLFLLEVMNKTINKPDDLSPYAPRILTYHAPIDKIGEIIGPKGKMINQIQEETGVDITIEEDGTVYIASADASGAEKALEIIEQIVNPKLPEVGEDYSGTVVKTTTFGAFVNLTPGIDGLLHISQIRNLAGGQRVGSVDDVLKQGDKVEVTVTQIDSEGKISLAVKGAQGDIYSKGANRPRTVVAGGESENQTNHTSRRVRKRTSR